MKANKALKRLAKIEALISDVTQRYSAGAPPVRKMLQEAKAAVTRAKEAVNLRTTSGTAKDTSAQHSKPTSKAPQSAKPKRRLSAAGRRAIQEALQRRWAEKRQAAAKSSQAPKKAAAPKKTAVKKAAPAKARKRSAPIKKAAKKTAAKMAPSSRQATEAAGSGTNGGPPKLKDRTPAYTT